MVNMAYFLLWCKLYINKVALVEKACVQQRVLEGWKIKDITATKICNIIIYLPIFKVFKNIKLRNEDIL